MPKSIMNESQWAALFMAGEFPDIYIHVWNLRARIIANGRDITDMIPDGQRLGIEGVGAAGGTITMSGYYPPSDEIIRAIKALRKKRVGDERNA